MVGMKSLFGVGVFAKAQYVEAGILPKSQWLILDLSKIIAWMGVLGDMLAQRAFAKTPGTHDA